MNESEVGGWAQPTNREKLILREEKTYSQQYEMTTNKIDFEDIPLDGKID